MLSTCRGYRKTQLVLAFDLVYPLLWVPMYKFVDVVPEPSGYEDWTWRLFLGWMAVTMFACAGRALFRTFRNNDSKEVYRGMLEWLGSSLIFCSVQWVANGVLGYWGAFWITCILRFFLVIITALFILDVRRLSKDAELQSLRSGLQLSSSSSVGVPSQNNFFKCKIM